MKRNAFDVLLKASAKQQATLKSSSARKAPGAGGYVNCPICNHSVPKQFAELHVEQCVATAERRSATPRPECTPQCQPLQLPPQLNQEAQQSLLAVNQSDQYLQPGTGHEDVQPAVAAAHHQHAFQATDLSKPAASVHPARLPDGTEDRHSTGIIGGAGLSAQYGDNGDLQHSSPHPPDEVDMAHAAERSAFDVLLQGQRKQQSLAQHFHLEQHRPGLWRWHWWTAGQQTPEQQQLLRDAVWSAVSFVSGVTRGDSSGSKGGRAAAKVRLHLHTNAVPGEGGAVTWQAPLPSNTPAPEGGWHGGPSVLKSALQKNVRLCRAPCAVRCALWLLKEDAAAFLRRLAIICVEDAVLHPSLPLVVWLMAAQAKGYTLGRSQADMLLQMTYQLAAIGVRDCLPPAQGIPGTTIHSFCEADERLPPDEAVLVKSLLLRAAFGGMAGDVVMLKGYAAYWAARFEGSLAAGPPMAAAGIVSSSECMRALCTPLQPMRQAQPCLGIQMRDEAGTANAGSGDDLAGLAYAATTQGRPYTGAPSPFVFIPASALLAAMEHGTRPYPATPAPTPHHISLPEVIEGACLQVSAASPPPPALLPLMQTPHRTRVRCAAAEADLQTPAPPPRECAAPGTPVTGTACSPTSVAPACAVPLTSAPGTFFTPLPATARLAAAIGTHHSGDASMPSPWLLYVRCIYHALQGVPPPLDAAFSVGALRRSDLPFSAVDFHCSDILDQLLGTPQVQEAAEALTCASWGPEGDPEACLRSAIWLFRSSSTPKRWLFEVPACDTAKQRQGQQAGSSRRGSDGAQVARLGQGKGETDVAGTLTPSMGVAVSNSAMDLPQYEHFAVKYDEERDNAVRERLQPFWGVVAPHADRYSQSFIARRFRPGH